MLTAPTADPSASTTGDPEVPGAIAIAGGVLETKGARGGDGVLRRACPHLLVGAPGARWSGSESGDRRPAFSPDDRWIAFSVVKREGNERKLHWLQCWLPHQTHTLTTSPL